MNRVRVVACVCLGLWSLSGCQSLFGSNSSRSSLSGSGPDGGACTKDPVTIKNVMLAPPVCSATNPCPCGTYCSSQTGGNCVADCVDDTWCAPGYACSAFGQCLNANPPDGGGTSPTTNPTCPTNAALLDSLGTNPRSCQFDDVCPYGSYCNRVTELCHSDCRADSDCAYLNNPDQTFVCDCLGQCAAVGVPKTPPSAFLPSMTVSPDHFGFVQPTTITAPDWGDSNSRTITVTVVSQFVNKSGSTITGPKVTIRANPGPGLMVQCGPTGTMMGQSCSFTVDPASDPAAFTQVNGTYVSKPFALTVQPSTAAPTATSWSLRLDSTDVINSPQTVNLRYDNTMPTLVASKPVQGPSPDPGFRGTGYAQITTPTGETIEIPVKADVLSGDYFNSLVLYDDTQLLSPSGKLVLSQAGEGESQTTDIETFIQPTTDSDVALSTSLSGSVLSRLIDAQFYKDPVTGTVSGTFSRTIYTEFLFNPIEGDFPPYFTAPSSPLDPPMSGTFTLKPTTSTAGFCSSDPDCTAFGTAGGKCDLGFCSAGPPRRTVGSVPGLDFQLSHNQMQAWNADAHNPFGAAETYTGLVSIFAPDPVSAALVIPASITSQPNGPSPPLAFISGEPTMRGFGPSNSNGDVRAFQSGPLAIPLLTQHDGTNVEPVSQLLQECLSELRSVPASGDFAQGSSSFPSDIFNTGAHCINLGRVAGGASDRLTFQRMLEGWLTVHSFVGREGLEEAQAAQALTDVGIDQTTTSSLGPTPTLEQLLGVMESGLGFVLDQSTNANGYYQYLQPSDIWATIDYRTQPNPPEHGPGCYVFNGDPNGPLHNSLCNNGGQTTSVCVDGPFPFTGICVPAPLTDTPQYEQLLGVPTFILQTSAAYMRVLQAYLQQLAAQSFGQAADNSPGSSRLTGLARYGSGMRLVMAAEELAVGINKKANIDTASGTCPSDNPMDCQIIAQRFNAVRDELNVVRAQVVTAAQTLHDQTNPFNIPEDDVPLFFGDPSGTSSQYFAASDYLLTGWALPAVAQAQSFLDAARGAWIQESQASVQDELNTHNRQQEIDQLMSKYGSPILANCGSIEVPDGTGGFTSLDSTQVIPYFSDPTHQFNDATNNTCFIDASCIGTGGLDGREALRSALALAFEDQSGSLSPGDDPTAHPDGYTGLSPTLADLFVRSEVCKDSAENQPGGKFGLVDLLAVTCPMDLDVPDVNFGVPQCSVHKFPGDLNLYFDAGPAGALSVLPVAALYGPIKASDVGPGNFYPNALTPTTVGIAGGINFANGPQDNIYNYVEFRTDTKPYLPTDALSFTPAGWFQVATTTCGSGKNGHLTHDYPRPSSKGFPSSCYKGALGTAYGQIQSDQLKVQSAQETLSNGSADLHRQFAQCSQIDSINMQLAALGDQAATMENDYQVVSGIVGGFNAGLSGGVTGVLTFGLSDVFGDAAAEAQQQFQIMTTEFDDDEKSTACWNSYETLQGNLNTATTNVKIAAADVNTQATTFKNLKLQNLQNVVEGVAMFQQEQRDPVGSLGHQFWVDEKVEQFKKEFDWARRLTYLAMQAVEYEFQQSLPYRSQIVSATTPAQMQGALIALQQEEVSRTINARRPQSSSIVLSLRDDVLKLSDDSDLPSGERNWTPAQRFESRVSDAKYAYYDSQGNYLGQAVPFTLNPTGVLQTRCGERVWDVTATIQGDGIEASAPGASVLLLKRNTFESQYCDGHAPVNATTSAGTPLASAIPQMQLGVIHDSADLFQPGAAVDLSDATEFTAALLYPWFNIPKTEFYATSYQNGSSAELAGRGLYGDYVLLFPQQELSAGFELKNVEDVLLRLDYLSIDNLSQ